MSIATSIHSLCPSIHEMATQMHACLVDGRNNRGGLPLCTVNTGRVHRHVVDASFASGNQETTLTGDEAISLTESFQSRVHGADITLPRPQHRSSLRLC